MEQTLEQSPLRDRSVGLIVDIGLIVPQMNALMNPHCSIQYY